MAKGKAWKFKHIENMNIHAFLTLVTYEIEEAKLKEYLRTKKPNQIDI